MNIEEFKKKATEELTSIFSNEGLGKLFSVVPDEILADEEENISMFFKIDHHDDDVAHSHLILIAWNPIDGLGLELGEHGDIYELTPSRLMAQMYFDLAYKDSKFAA